MTYYRLSWDTSELDALTRTLEGAPARLHRAANTEMHASSTRLLKKMKGDASGHRYLRTNFVSALAKEEIGDLSWEVGFDKKGQGKLANIIVFGSINNAPVYDFARPLWTEGMALERRLGDPVEESVLGGADG